ncbi:MAG: polymer-forming cytoskeletal protein [Proteobacteria bacterium]|nr:polymer-forming cytoskeletal protein [Pseudomonadota bacterium]
MTPPEPPHDNPNFLGHGRNTRPGLRGAAPPAAPRRVVDMPNLRRSAAEPTSPRQAEGGRRLVVGKDITLAGQVSKCDSLIVEGTVEGMRYEGQALEVTASGTFSGNVEVHHAEIAGIFDGNLTVRTRLLIRPTGRVSGSIKYGEIEVSAGGRISGEVQIVELISAREAAEPAAGEGTFTSSERLAGE